MADYEEQDGISQADYAMKVLNQGGPHYMQQRLMFVVAAAVRGYNHKCIMQHSMGKPRVHYGPCKIFAACKCKPARKQVSLQTGLANRSPIWPPVCKRSRNLFVSVFASTYKQVATPLLLLLLLFGFQKCT